jgi:hypothetical protein
MIIIVHPQPDPITAPAAATTMEEDVVEDVVRTITKGQEEEAT